MAKKARERSAELAETALDRSTAALERAAERGAPLAAEARRRSAELAETALDRGGDEVKSRWRWARSKV